MTLGISSLDAKLDEYRAAVDNHVRSLAEHGSRSRDALVAFRAVIAAEIALVEERDRVRYDSGALWAFEAPRDLLATIDMRLATLADGFMSLVVEDSHGDRHALLFERETSIAEQVKRLCDNIIICHDGERVRYGLVPGADVGAARLFRGWLPAELTYTNPENDSNTDEA